MPANISYQGTDLDTLFSPHVVNNVPSLTNYSVLNVDIQNRYDPLSNPAQANLGSRIPATNIKTSASGWAANTDLASIYCGNAGQYSLSTPSGGTKTVTGGWISPQVWTHTLTVTFANATALTNYFFYGGRIQLSANQSTGTSADNTLQTMLASMGTLIIYDAGHYRTGAGGILNNGNVGGSNIGITTIPMFQITDGSPYSGSTYTVSMVANAAAGSATVLTIKTVLTLVTAGSIIDTYTGTYTSEVSQRNHPTQSIPTFSGSMIAGNSGASSASPGSSALQIKNSTGTVVDGLYWIKPSPNSTAQQVWCDMNTDGGGWMMIARTHISGAASSWGWKGSASGSLSTFSSPYHLGWGTNWDSVGATFSEFIYGNRNNVNNNTWGPFIYKRSGFTYSNLLGSDTQQSAASTTLTSNTSVFNFVGAPGMQAAIGFPVTGTSNSNYYMRDCCGYSGYGITPNGLVTTYINDPTIWYIAGPFGLTAGAVDGSNNYIQLSGNPNYGGTNQVMVMVR